MTTSLIIDSDTHIDETDQTWEHVGDESMRPRSGSFDQASAPGDYWAIDGYKVHKAKRLAANTRTTKQTRELLDIDARLRDVSKLGVGVQVIYWAIVDQLARLPSERRWPRAACAGCACPRSAMSPRREELLRQGQRRLAANSRSGEHQDHLCRNRRRHGLPPGHGPGCST